MDSPTMDLEELIFPPSPVWNVHSNAVGTPGGGLLYLVGQQTAIKYIGPISDTKVKDVPAMKPRKCITQISCDPDWSKQRCFATLDVEDIVNIWDLDQCLIVKGHRGHSLGVGRTRSQSSSNRFDSLGGTLCYLESNVVLSNIDNFFLRFSVASNQFTTIKINYVFERDPVVVMKANPYDSNIVACGSKRGLVTIINLDQKCILHTLSAHNNTVTSLDWQQMTIFTPSEPKVVSVDIVKSAVKLEQRPKAQAHSKENRLRGPPNTIIDEDDAFDIYDFDDGADEFGVISRPTYGAAAAAVKETKSVGSSENFNFVEACQNLKEDILQATPAMDESLIASDFEKLSMINELAAALDEPEQSAVQTPTKKKTIKSLNESDLIETFEHSSDDSFVHVMGEQVVAKRVTFLASASSSKEGIIWLWNVDAGSSAHKIGLKRATKNHGNERLIHVLWTNEHTILANTPNGDLVQYHLSTTDDGKITSKLKDVHFIDQNVSGLFLCPSLDAGSPPIIWTKSTNQQIQSTQLTNPPRMLRQYATIPMAMYIISECPHDPNKIAFAGAGRRINLMNLSNLTKNRVPLTFYANGVQSKILYLSWHPVHENVIAFGTEEGRIGIYDLNKTSNFPAIVTPFCSKSIYQITWAQISQGPDKPDTERYVLLTCTDGELRYIPDSGDNKYSAIHLPMEKKITAVSANEQYIGLGTKDGQVLVYKPYIVGRAFTQLVFTGQISTKYISECAWNPMNPSKVAFASFDRGINIFNMDQEEPNDGMVFLDSPPGTTHVKWSGQTEHLLVSCSYDGSVCVWNTDTKICLVTHMLSNSSYSAMFMPNDENYVICSGRRETLVVFDIRTKTASQPGIKSEKIFSDSHTWATLLQNDTQQLMANEKKHNRKAQRKLGQQQPQQPPVQQADGEESDVGIIYESDSPMNQSVSDSINYPTVVNPVAAPHNGLQFQYTTICHLTSKEFNKDPLRCLLLFVEDERKYASTMNSRLFNSRADMRGLLEEELKNHKLSRTDSVAHVLIPSLLCELQTEIQAKAQEGRLTESDLAIAPKVSYSFWKECCQKYFQQMLRNGFPLLALPYVQTLSEVHGAIDVLCNKHYFREAWILARLNIDPSDSVFVDILEKWISWLESNGNLDGAALIAATTGQIPRALTLLSKRRNKPAEVIRIMQILQSKSPIPFAVEALPNNA